MKSTKQVEQKIKEETKVLKAELKDGVVLSPFGANSKIDNSNLTDEIAILLLKKGRATKEQFKQLPNNL